MALGYFARLIKGITLVAAAATGSYWVGHSLFPPPHDADAYPPLRRPDVAASAPEALPKTREPEPSAHEPPKSTALAAPAAPHQTAPPADFRITTLKPNRPISDLIYGVNFHAEAETHTTELAYPIVRWGGNHTSRYNWRSNVANRAGDWFFINMPGMTFPHGGKTVSLADHVILANKPAGRDVLFTLPMLGWIPKDGEKRWAFSVKKYGAQQKVEPYDPDAGNGVKPNGDDLTGNDPADTSMKIEPSWHVAWLAHMRELLGGKTAANGGMKFFALDNEPDLWSITHRDLHRPYARDELWSRTVAYATALKAADPAIQITGPVVGTWCGYYGSGADIHDEDGDCKTGPDRAKHQGLPLVQWYLRQICAHEQKTGVRVVDYLDVHYYPEGLDLRSETPPVARERVERVRALYDAGYRDPSWIGEAVQLVPRMRGWIAAECPAVKLAVTEYRFGYEFDSLSSSLAQIEALLIFGRDGVDLATTWGEIKSGSLYENAFRLFLDYDGQGANARSGKSLGVEGAAADVLAYAIAVDKRILVYLLNKGDTARRQTLALDQSYQGLRQFVFDKRGLTKAPSPSGLSFLLPPASVTLVELTP